MILRSESLGLVYFVVYSSSDSGKGWGLAGVDDGEREKDTSSRIFESFLYAGKDFDY